MAADGETAMADQETMSEAADVTDESAAEEGVKEREI